MTVARPFLLLPLGCSQKCKRSLVCRNSLHSRFKKPLQTRQPNALFSVDPPHFLQASQALVAHTGLFQIWLLGGRRARHNKRISRRSCYLRLDFLSGYRPHQSDKRHLVISSKPIHHSYHHHHHHLHVSYSLGYPRSNQKWLSTRTECSSSPCESSRPSSRSSFSDCQAMVRRGHTNENLRANS